MKINDVTTLSDYADRHRMNVKVIRRLARKGELFDASGTPIGATKFGAQWVVPTGAPKPVIPAHKTRKRPDGRERYIVYATASEHGNIVGIVGPENVVNPREVAKARRAARKAE